MKDVEEVGMLDHLNEKQKDAFKAILALLMGLTYREADKVIREVREEIKDKATLN